MVALPWTGRYLHFMTPAVADPGIGNVAKLLRQQAALARFGSFAFRETDLSAILNEAVRICAACLGVEHAKICRYRLEHDDLLIVAGVGWKAEIVGQVVSQANETSPQGRAYVTGQPVICHNVVTANDMKLPPFYAQHGIVSTVDVIVKGLEGSPFGILEVDSTTPQTYDQHDIDFLTGFANVLAESVATASRVEVLRLTMEQMQALVAEKNQLLADKNILAEELQHRVRNNLQLITAMVADQLKQTLDRNGQIGLRGILRRVTALAKVYDHLLGIGLSHTVDFAQYAELLCRGLPDLQAEGTGSIVLSCDVAAMPLDLATVTALGLVVTELVANSYEHAFPDGVGHVALAGGPALRHGWGRLTLSDDGVGYQTSGGSSRHGVGLVHRLIEQVGGHVAVHVDRGTTWELVFPRFQQANGTAPH